MIFSLPYDSPDALVRTSVPLDNLGILSAAEKEEQTDCEVPARKTTAPRKILVILDQQKHFTWPLCSLPGSAIIKPTS